MATNTYITKQGDMWDYIAYKVYGSEKYTGFLMQNNLKYLDIFVFSSGTVLNVPDLPEEVEETKPSWR